MYLCYWFWTSNIKYVAEIKKKIQRKNEIINPFSDQNGLRFKKKSITKHQHCIKSKKYEKKGGGSQK